MNAQNNDFEVIAWDAIVDSKKQITARAPKAPKVEIVKESHGSQEYRVEIVAGESIRLSGIYMNRKDPVAFDVTFKVGDFAEYDSYNLSYTGRITSIGQKTVTIQHYPDSPKASRLTLREFAWRNWDFDAEEIAERNADTLMHI